MITDRLFDTEETVIGAVAARLPGSRISRRAFQVFFAAVVSLIAVFALAVALPSEAQARTYPESSPAAVHGKLSVKGTDLVDKSGQRYQLYGMSTHGIAWFPQYINQAAFTTLRDSWNSNVIRLAMYTAEYDGYCTGGNQAYLRGLVEKGVEYASDLGMYVIIDWHILSDGNPLTYKTQAIEFFRYMSQKYKDYDNVLYEICNEPNGSGGTWVNVTAYAKEVIPVIRANDPDAVIICGTPNWDQYVGEAAAAPLPFDNVLYSLHFYAATHGQWLRDQAVAAIQKGLPLIVSEFGVCDASGTGGIDYSSAAQWMDLIDRYNLSFCKWNLSNKQETSAAIASWCTKTSGWTQSDLSASGSWIMKELKAHPPVMQADPAKGIFYDTIGTWVQTDGWTARAVALGLMNGYTDAAGKPTGYFGPWNAVSRQDAAVVLYRLANPDSKATTDSAYFEDNRTPCVDVPDKTYATAALNWAYDKGIMTGYVEGEEGEETLYDRPNQKVLRDEFAKMMYVYASRYGLDLSGADDEAYSSAPDAASVPDWAEQGMSWCFTHKILTGNSQTGMLDPESGANRAELAKMIVMLASL